MNRAAVEHTKSEREVYISDFRSCVTEKKYLSAYTAKNKWECVPYETKKASGALLIASKNSYPPPLTVKPGLSGWYRIYVCMGDIGWGNAGGGNHIDLKLSGDEFPYTVCPCKMGPYTSWTTTECVEEAFWKCADMTGQSVTISKPDIGVEYTANIYWLRFVPMSENEVEALKNSKPKRTMFAHMDGDYHSMDVTEDPHDYCKSIYSMKDSDVGIICEEVINDICDYAHPGDDYVYRDDFNPSREKLFSTLTKDRSEVYKEQIEYAHKYGIKMFAGHRMQLSNFAFPLELPIFHIPFVDQNGDKTCRSRDGIKVDFLSYGYEEVQDFMISAMLESAKHGFDGVLNIWTRGVHLLFEEPVEKRFKEKFGDTADFRRLKEDDPRLWAVRGDIISDFYKKLRKALLDYAESAGREPMKIYLTGCYDVNDSKKEGIDFERLAAEGLIDGVIQSKKKMEEAVNDVLAPDGLIDLDRYSEKAKTEKMIRTFSGSSPEMMAEGSAAYRSIADKYGLDYYSEIQWENIRRPEEYVNGAKQIYSAHAKGISLWDCYPCRVIMLSEWAAVSHLGDREAVIKMSENPDDYHTIHKVLSYNGKDIRYYSPNWRG